ncbi:DUF2894 domain-containing protein [Achromobacter aloeverae]|uniref:DUF2894 domain-containing protein n=2 Tax=Achromobacter aloeverae TaxID=1750518 RepID=A0A4Q1HFU6_9BURK|nr:DUF2894 domain-containing protein [Achromobacter aloeverae]
MSADPASGQSSVQALLTAWREQGWARLDTVSFVFMEGLARRAAAQEGEARQRLDARLAALVEAYAARIEKAGGAATAAAGDAPASASAPAVTNAEGVTNIAAAENAAIAKNATAAGNNAIVGNRAIVGNTAHGKDAAVAPTALALLRDELVAHAAGNKTALSWTTHYPELPLLDEFQQLWSRVSASMRVQESQFQVPDNAGPLNSSHLVHRSLTLMRELAPGYLQHFLAYVDVLSWLEPMVVPAIPPREAAKPATKAGGKATSGARKTPAKPARKTTRTKPAEG